MAGIVKPDAKHLNLCIGEEYIYHGTTRFLGLHNHDELELSVEQRKLYGKDAAFKIYPEYYLIKVNQFNDIAKNTLYEWIYFLKNEEVKDSFRAKGLSEAKTKLSELKFSPAELEDYHNYIKIERIRAGEIESSYGVGMLEGEKIGIEKGEKLGLEKGRQEGEKVGIEKGIEEGKKLGLQEGITQAARSMVQKLLAKGFPLEEVTKLTDLSLKEISALQKEKS